MLYVLTCILIIFTFAIIWHKSSEDITEICLNEICVNNYTCYQSVLIENGTQYSTYDDYIEIYNLTDRDVSLDKYCITNDKEELYYLSGLVIPAKGYLLLSAKEEQEFEGEQIVPFEFDANSDNHIYLINDKGTIIEDVLVPKIPYDTVYCRKADGDEDWHCAMPSPKEKNENAVAMMIPTLPAPIFSKEGGFYNVDDEVVLSLGQYQKAINEGVDIYYTLDCSTPTKENGIKYENAINLGSVATRKSKYDNREFINAHSAYNRIQRGEGLDVCMGDESIGLDEDTCVVISARVISSTGEMSPVVTNSYFVEDYLQADYDGVAVVSLTTEPDNLFDYEKGIYVAGEVFETNILINPTPARIDLADANYWGTGKQWERPVQIEFFDLNKTCKFKTNAGLRIKGNASRAYSQKSMKLYAREELSGEKRFVNDFFDDSKEVKSVALFACGQDIDSRMKDYMLHSLTKNRSVSSLDFIPCILFLEGEYWGFYYITQEHDASFMEAYYEVEKDDVILIKNGVVKEGKSEDIKEYENFIYFANNTDFSIPENLEKLYSQMDIQSFVDYFCIQAFIARKIDWPQGNWAVWKTKNIGAGPYEDGKWRWILFDLNAHEGETEAVLVDYDSIDFLIYHHEYFLPLIRIPEIRQLFVTSMMDMMNTCFDEQYVEQWIDEYVCNYESSVVRTNEKYHGKTKQEFDDSIESIRYFFDNRQKYMLEDMINEIPINGTKEMLTLKISDAAAGNVIVNTIEPDLSDGIWHGDYFTEYPVTLMAVTNEGYEFVGWQGDVNSNEKMVQVPMLVGGTNIEAVFRKH